jgi:hypothetical protein
VNVIRRPPTFSPSFALTLATAILICGCRAEPASLKLHFLRGFVPGTHNVFATVPVAVALPKTRVTQGRFEAGAVFGPSGDVQRRMFVENFGRVLADALVSGLSYAGAKPTLLDTPPADHRPPSGAAFLMIVEPTDVEVNKHFGSRTTVHGRYFTMHSQVRLWVLLFDRAGHAIFSRQISGAEDEPPAPVGHEEFLPLETDPAESLSVALSRAVGALVLEPSILHALGKPR